MKNQTYRMTMLYDFYGDLLTDRQKEFYDLYYNEDLSLAEIAENHGITRQGVRDIIVRAEGTLQEVEDKTSLIRKHHAMQEELGNLSSMVNDIRLLNLEDFHSEKLSKLCDVLEDAIGDLRKD